MGRWMQTAAALLLGAGIAVGEAQAADEVNVATGATLPGPGLAVHGYDVVAYFTEGRPTRGAAQHSSVHGGATYRFASRAHREAFERDPERYLPAYGGFCAFGVSVGKKFDGDPHYWRIENGRLFLNLNQEIQGQWLEAVAERVAEADLRWPSLRTRAVSAL